jgi:hypothetical protein
MAFILRGPFFAPANIGEVSNLADVLTQLVNLCRKNVFFSIMSTYNQVRV